MTAMSICSYLMVLKEKQWQYVLVSHHILRIYHTILDCIFDIIAKYNL